MKKAEKKKKVTKRNKTDTPTTLNGHHDVPPVAGSNPSNSHRLATYSRQSLELTSNHSEQELVDHIVMSRGVVSNNTNLDEFVYKQEFNDSEDFEFSKKECEFMRLLEVWNVRMTYFALD